MHRLLQDLRYGLRRLKNDPVFAAVAVLTLALGIGANSAIFSIVNAVILRPLPYRDPQNLVLLAERWPQFPRLSLSYLNYVDWRDQSHSFEAVGAVRNAVATLTGAGEAERVPVQMVTANLFGILGVTAEVGRTFRADEDRAGGAPVALIGHALWQRQYSASRGVVGRPITLDNQTYSIIGVMPPGFDVLQQAADVMLPFEPWARTLPDDRSWHPGILPIARLKPGVSVEQARAEMNTIARRLERQYPENDTNVSALVDLMQSQVVANVRPALLLLVGAVGLVLLIACANVANLLLVRATGRRREIAVRVALGASRGHVVRQLLAESVLLSVLGAGLGLVLASAALPPLVRLAGTSLPRSKGVSLDLTVLGFTALVSVLAGVLFGLAPARHAWKVDLRDALGESNRGGASTSVLRTRAALVVSEIAIAMLLLVGAGLLLRSFERLANVSPGFSVDHIFVADIVRSPTAYRDPSVRLGFFDHLFEQIGALPGVRSAGGISVLPVSGTGSVLHFNIQGRAPTGPSRFILANYRVVSAGYRKTLDIPLITGRWLEDGDREDAPPVVVVNASFAKTFFPGQSPIGQHIQVGATPDKDIPWMEIVGVVGDVKQALATAASNEMYVPFRQADKVLPVFALSIVARTSGDPLVLGNAVRDIARRLDANQPVTNMRTMEQNIAKSIADSRFRTVLLVIFAGVALVLAAVGIFGVMAYSVSQRTRELGVRIALGASRGQVLQLVLGHGVRLTLMGVVVGLIAAFAMVRYVSSFLFNVAPQDPLTLVGMTVVLVVVSLGACYLPARRATRVDPVVALRQE